MRSSMYDGDVLPITGMYETYDGERRPFVVRVQHQWEPQDGYAVTVYRYQGCDLIWQSSEAMQEVWVPRGRTATGQHVPEYRGNTILAYRGKRRQWTVYGASVMSFTLPADEVWGVPGYTPLTPVEDFVSLVARDGTSYAFFHTWQNIYVIGAEKITRYPWTSYEDCGEPMYAYHEVWEYLVGNVSGGEDIPVTIKISRMPVKAADSMADMVADPPENVVVDTPDL